MIINVKKYLFLGAKEEIDRFLARAQQQGIIEFIPPDARKSSELPLPVQKVIHAMKIVKKLPQATIYEGKVDQNHAQEVAERVIELKEEIDRLGEEKRVLGLEIARIAPFGDFSLDDIDFLEKEAGAKIQFFCAKTGRACPESLIYINTAYDLDYFLSINGQEVVEGILEMRIDQPLGVLQERLTAVEESLRRFNAELLSFSGYLEYLNHALLDLLNVHNLQEAKKTLQYPEDLNLFAVEAWVPENKGHQMFSLLDAMAIHCEMIAIEEGERVPTCMENKGTARLGEDLVRIYDAPAASDKDPSGWVFWFFALFFAMIVADGGYGLLYLGILAYVKWKYPILKSQARRFFKLAVILSTGCVLWGIATAAFFGLEIHPKSFVGRISVIQYLAEKKAEYHLKMKDDVYEEWVHRFPGVAQATTGVDFLDGAEIQRAHRVFYPILDDFSDHILLEFSLLVGVIHIMFSLLRYFFRNWAGIGWVAFLIGGYLYFPKILNATSMFHYLGWADKAIAPEFGLQLIYCGGAVALILALIQKKWQGLGEIANMIQVFADVLSYLRLYALGLAGAMMASTFNGIGEDIGLFVGWIVIVLGHLVNILLGLMAGVIHGLRLNFIEWYHYSFDGGGKLFNPLKCLHRN